MSGKEKRRYYKTSAEKIFALQPGVLKKQQIKQDYVIVVKGIKHFMANVYQKDCSQLFDDNLCLRTGDRREQLNFPFIKWTVNKESLHAKNNCVFCSIAWMNREHKERQVCYPLNRPGKLFVYPSARNAHEPENNKKAGLAPVRVVMKNARARMPVAVEKIEVCEEFKKLIKITKYSKKTLLAGDTCEMEFLVNKNQLPFGSYGIPLTVSYQNSSKEKAQEIKIPLKFIIASPMYFAGNRNMKMKKIILEEENANSDDECINKKAKYMLNAGGVLRVIKKPLKAYALPAPIRQLHEATRSQTQTIPSDLQIKLQKYETVLSRQLTSSNYVAKFTAVLNLEEFHEEREIAKFNMWKVELQAGNNFMYRLTVGDGLAEGRPSLMAGDVVFITIFTETDETIKKATGKEEIIKKTTENEKKNKKKTRRGFYGFIKRVKLRDIVFECEDLAKVFKPKMKFNIQFAVNRYTYRLCYRALELLDHSLLKILLPQGEYRKSFEKRELVFFNEEIAGNPEQAQAITNIVSRSCTPFPYIIFGPPGTGKTKTLVEAILQNWAVGKSQLVCASSNSAADVIVEELLKLAKRNAYLGFEPEGNILRIYSLSVEFGSVSERILQHNIHNFDATNEAKFPLLPLVLKTPIIVGTLATAAKLSLEGVPANHFSHVFVDECGHCTEPECILAVAGLINNEENSSGADWWGGNGGGPLCTQLVLAGDPQQLGSSVQCDLSEMYNFGYSLLERLLNTTDMYQRNARTGKYNPEVITKLTRNYRSHRDILKIPNQLFYHGELVESGNPEVLNSCSKINFLPQKGHPIIFHGVTGLEERDNSSPSYYNLNEVDQVVTYIHMLIEEANAKKMKLTLKDIGVVTPYKKQVQKLVQTFAELQWKDIAVGSVDLFQGSEKLIIIISTVRASCTLKNASGKAAGRELEFVNEPKRFNVALTRAKALLIVIGDPEILQHQSYWKLFMDYCLHLGTYQGSMPGHYTRSNKLVKLRPVLSSEKPKMKKKKKKSKCSIEEESVVEENLENGGAGDYVAVPKEESPPSSHIVANPQKTFRDIIMDLDIEDFTDDVVSNENEGNEEERKISENIEGQEKMSGNIKNQLKNDDKSNNNLETCLNKNIKEYEFDSTWKNPDIPTINKLVSSMTISDLN